MARVPEIRSFFLLQGPHGPFMRELAGTLRAQGHQACWVAFNAGECPGFRPRHGLAYRGRPAHFRGWLARQLAYRQVTDLVIYGDCRPFHRIGMALAQQQGARIWVLEEGYLRPYWVTLERDGVNGHSRLPPRFEQWLQHANPSSAELNRLDQAQPVGRATKALGFWVHVYFAWRTLGFWLYPFYRSHRPVSYVPETLAWARKLWRRIWGRDRRSRRRARALLHSNTPFFLVPLQLDADAQVTRHSGYASMAEFIQHVMQSFRDQARADSLLVVKGHPLDSELTDYQQRVTGLAEATGVADRLVFLFDASIPELAQRAAGTITVNSTVGLQAIHHGCPTLALGRAIYNLPGLTAQCTLDDFWTQRPKPNARRYRLFRYFVLQESQINGNFYTRRGRRMLLPVLARRLSAAAPARPQPGLQSTEQAAAQADRASPAGGVHD